MVELIPVDMNLRRPATESWPDIDIEVDLHQALEAATYARFEALIAGWYVVANCEGFGGGIHSMDGPPYVNVGTGKGSWWIDMGSTPDEALRVLINAIKGFCSAYQIPRVSLTVPRSAYDG